MGIWLKNNILFIIIGALVLSTTSCVEESARKGRPIVKSNAGATTSVSVCTQIYNTVDFTCTSNRNNACPAGTHTATASEKSDVIEEVNGLSELTQEEADLVIENINSAAVVCVDGGPVLRPTGQVYVKKDFCICLGGKSDTIADCTSFCSSKNDQTSKLYGSVTLGPEISSNKYLGNLKNWCTAEIPGEDLVSPSCTLEVFDGTSTTNLTMDDIPVGGNSFSVNISTLAYETPYVATIVESQSGSNARSQSFQIYRKKAPDTSETPTGPLRIMPVGQYTCLTRAGSTDETGNYFNNAARLHFYFPADNTPPALGPEKFPFLFCHDINRYGNFDSPEYPRLEHIPSHFAVWDQTDLRFVDQNGNSRPDINETIEERLRTEYNISRTINIFSLFSWPNRPEVTTAPNVGFFMQPWIDGRTGRAFCPTQEQYNGNDPTFRILKEVVGVNTEGIYLSEKEPESLTDDQGNTVSAPQDVLIVRENVLKKIWFYIENGVKLIPDDITANTRTVNFYWPPDPANPLTRKSDQKLYTVRAPDSIGKGGDTFGLTSTVRPPDKRFGCVPALD